MIARFAVSLFVLSAISPLSAGTTDGQSVPAPEISVFESNRATVAALFAGRDADLVLVDAGFDTGFCTGARCSVERAGVPVAEVVVAEASRERAVALITQIENNQTIQTGDTVKLKTI